MLPTRIRFLCANAACVLASVQPVIAVCLLAAEPPASEQSAVLPAQGVLRGEADGGAVWVVSDGIGTDIESAKLDAYRNAVRQAVGAYVDATTIVANDKLIADDIIALSGAFISKTEVLPGSESKDGSFTRLRVKARVETGKVLSALHKKRVPTKSDKVVIDTDSIVAELATKEDRLANAERLLTKLFDGYPQKCFRASIVGEPKPTKQEGENVDLLCRVRIETDVEAWKEFSQALREVLKVISMSQKMRSVGVRALADLPRDMRLICDSQYQVSPRLDFVPLIDPRTLVVHSSVHGQEASCLGMKAFGRAEKEKFRHYLYGWDGRREEDPKEHFAVAVLVGDPSVGEDQRWEEFAIPETLGASFPSRWETKPYKPSSQGNLLNDIRGRGDSRLQFAVVQEDSGRQIDLYTGFCRRVGLIKGRGPALIAPCVFLVGGLDPAGTATGIEFTVKFSMPRHVIEQHPAIRCVLK